MSPKKTFKVLIIVPAREHHSGFALFGQHYPEGTHTIEVTEEQLALLPTKKAIKFRQLANGQGIYAAGETLHLTTDYATVINGFEGVLEELKKHGLQLSAAEFSAMARSAALSAAGVGPSPKASTPAPAPASTPAPARATAGSEDRDSDEEDSTGSAHTGEAPAEQPATAPAAEAAPASKKKAKKETAIAAPTGEAAAQ